MAAVIDVTPRAGGRGETLLRLLIESISGCVGGIYRPGQRAFRKLAEPRRPPLCRSGAVGYLTMEHPFQAVHLVIPAQRDEFIRNTPLDAANHRPEIPNEDEESPNDIRCLPHLVYASKQFPDGMAPEQVVHPSRVQPRAKTRVVGTSSLPMVHAHL